MKKQNKIMPYLYTIGCILIINTANIYYAMSGIESTVNSFLKKSVYTILSICITVFPLIFVKPKQLLYFLIIILPFSFATTASIYFLQSTLSANMIITVINTNFSESTELIKSSITFIIICITSLVLYLIFLSRIHSSFKIPTTIKWSFTVILISLYSLLFIRNYRIASSFEKTQKQRIKLAFEFHKLRLDKIFPTNLIGLSINTYEQIKLKNKYNENTDNFSYNIVKTKKHQIPDIVVLVIGESSRYDHWSINGYHRETSPHLKSFKNIISFDYCFAPANLTEQSVPLLLSTATPENRNQKYHVKSIVSSYAEMGYNTYWISSQSYSTSSLLNIYKDEAKVRYLNTKGLDSKKNYDSYVINKLLSNKEELKNNKHFIIIHTLGSHFRYNQRYPKSFNQFTPSIKEQINLFDLKSHKIELINSYDNTILYTDFILSEIITTLKNIDRSSFMIYVSDHGENLGEDSLILHGGNTPSYYEIHVPMVLWYSDKYLNQNKQKLDHLNKNKTKLFPTTNLPKLLWELSNLSSKNFQTHSLCQEDYLIPDHITILGQKKHKYTSKELYNHF